MICLPVRWVLLAAGTACWLLGGCAHRYADTLNPHYGDYGVRKIGLITWCSSYVSQDPAGVYLHHLDLRDSPMKRSDKWDETLTPLITAQVQSRLRELKYEVLDVREDVTFGPEVKTSDALAAVHARHPEIQAVLLVSYIISPLNSYSQKTQDDPMGSVAVTTDTNRQTQTNYGSYTVIRNEYTHRFAAGANEVGGTNLRGQLKMVHLATGEMLWEIGDHSNYIVYSSNAAPGLKASSDQAVQAVCQRFGTVFTEPATGRLGFPPMQPR